jgi:ABC-type Zn uptake system ZnuABC Zn-binding protein ZnuA
MMKKILLLGSAVLAALVLFSCTSTSLPAYDIYVTVYPLEYIVNSITEGTGIKAGMVPGVTSHESSIDWSPKQIIAMTQAEYLFYVGANFDIYIDNQVETIFQNKDVVLVKLEDEFKTDEGNGLLIQGIVDTHAGSDSPVLGLDPHFWLSPKRMIDVTNMIYNKLIDPEDGYPEYTDDFIANRDTLVSNLIAIDFAYDLVINPSSQKIMTSTNLYGYLRTDYGLSTCSISPGYHEETDQFKPEQKDLIITEATENAIRYIVYEKNSSSPLSNAIFDALVELSVDPIKLEYYVLHSLTDESRAAGEDYYSIMMNTNLELLKLATGYTVVQE